jgi:hypothetical protein
MYNPSYSWWNWRPPAGFRFSWTDGVAIVVFALLTWSTWPLLGKMSILFPVVLGHFFLFCNVFRIPRKPELWWSAAFVVNVGVWLSFNRFTWSMVLLTQTPITLLVITRAVFGEDYHGIGHSLVPWGRRCEYGGVAQRACVSAKERYKSDGQQR